jgi:hypothetical protein
MASAALPSPCSPAPRRARAGRRRPPIWRRSGREAPGGTRAGHRTAREKDRLPSRSIRLVGFDIPRGRTLWPCWRFSRESEASQARESRRPCQNPAAARREGSGKQNQTGAGRSASALGAGVVAGHRTGRHSVRSAPVRAIPAPARAAEIVRVGCHTVARFRRSIAILS